jgi:hypothetical protein
MRQPIDDQLVGENFAVKSATDLLGAPLIGTEFRRVVASSSSAS